MRQPDVSAVFYHALRARALAHVDPLYRCKDAAMFEADLKVILADYVPVSHDEIVAAREGGKPLPARAIHLSFDDGLAECFTIARPLLLRYGVPCTFFVIGHSLDNRQLMHRNRVALCLAALDQPARDHEADLYAVRISCRVLLRSVGDLRAWAGSLRYRDRAEIDRLCAALQVDVDAYLNGEQPYMSVDQVRTLHADGFTIGAHTIDHPELDCLSPADRRQQVAASCRAIAELTGRARVPFAIPFNGLELPRDELASWRDELGIDLIYDSNNRMADRDFVVNRIWCDTPRGAGAGRSNLPRLLTRAKLYEPLRRLRRLHAGRPH